MVGLSVLGNDKYGVFPLRGKIMNAKDASGAQIISNKVLMDLIKILGLELSMVYKDTKKLRYGKIMIMTDMVCLQFTSYLLHSVHYDGFFYFHLVQDHDGCHIKGLIINIFYSLWPSLLKISPSFIAEFVAPLVKVNLIYYYLQSSIIFYY